MKLAHGLCALSAVVLLGLAAAPAQAANQLECAGTETNTYSPGLHLLTAQAVTAGIDVGLGCVSTTDPSLHTGSVSVSRQASLSCTSLLSVAPGTHTVVFAWDNGRTSTFAYTNTVTSAAGLLTVTGTGTVTDGEFEGATGVSVATVAALPAECLTTAGLTAQSGPIVLTIAGL